MHLNLLAQCSPSPQFKGLWRHPDDRSAAGYRSLSYWIALAQQLEKSCFDALFFADIHGIYDVYQQSWATAVRHAVQIPSIDPVLVIPALAAICRHLGFAVTYSTTYHPPYECARMFSSLDHLTDGRIAWNIVTSYLPSAGANGIAELLSHDERYDRADEYVAVVRSLWERSWDDDAVIRDAGADVFTDPRRVRNIDHNGRWFNVRGPHQCEPSPQRTPVLYQAGASDRGTAFAARHAEVVFLTLPDPVTGADYLAHLRALAAAQGRSPRGFKALQGAFVLVGRTADEVKARVDCVTRLVSNEGEIAKWCGWMGFDLASVPAETPVAEIRSQASRSVLEFLYRFDRDRDWTIADVREIILWSRRPHLRTGWLVGTPARVADQMNHWLESTGIDGFNLIPCPPSSGIDDICTLLIPELQRRRVFRCAYEPDRPTLRERYFGAGYERYGEFDRSSEVRG